MSIVMCDETWMREEEHTHAFVDVYYAMSLSRPLCGCHRERLTVGRIIVDNVPRGYVGALLKDITQFNLVKGLERILIYKFIFYL